MNNQDLLKSLTHTTVDYTPRATPSQYEDFLKGIIYTDFLEELKVRINDMKDYYETVDSKAYLETRGGLKALRLVAGIFEDLYENSKSDLSRK